MVDNDYGKYQVEQALDGVKRLYTELHADRDSIIARIGNELERFEEDWDSGNDSFSKANAARNHMNRTRAFLKELLGED